MRDAVERLLDHAGNTPVHLTALEAFERREPPARPGIYAAWVTTREGLEELGVDAEPPVLAYVGIATGGAGGTLERRIARHMDSGWLETNERLASRGRVLFQWEARMPITTPGRMYRGTDMTIYAMHQTTEWALEHVAWNWVVRHALPARIRSEEREAIATGQPILNLASADRSQPPQMRKAGTRFERMAARWLWHASWTALYTASRSESRFPKEAWGRRREWAVEDDGWPVPHSEAVERHRRSPPMPANDELERIIFTAAREARVITRHMVGRSSTAERRAWWAAHAGAPFLPGSPTVEDAMARSLQCVDESKAHCPGRLPSSERVAALVRLTGSLNRYGH